MADVKTMRAARLVAYNEPLVIQNIPVPKIGPYELLLNVKAAGFCRTDQDILTGDLPPNGMIQLPHTPSHEPAGVVAAIGSKVNGFKVGDRVAGLWSISDCNLQCDDCKRTDFIRCPKTKGAGINSDGAMAEYMPLDSRAAFKIPPGMSYEVSCVLVCAGATVYGAICAANIPVGGSIAILGLGGLGHIGVQLAKCMGYTVTAIDVRQVPIDHVMSSEIKPDVVINASTELDEKVSHMEKVDGAVNCNDSLASAQLGMRILKRGGTFVMVGGQKEISVSAADLIHRDIRIKGSLVCTQNQVHEMVDLVDRFHISVDVTPLDMKDVNMLLPRFHSKEMHGRLVVRINE